jgi:competence protein ComFB
MYNDGNGYRESGLMNFTNVMEPIVENLFAEYEKKYPLACNCGQCKLDILVIALNQLPSKYVASQSGELYMKALFLNPQLRSDVMRELARAAQIVSQNPRHVGETR